MCAHSLSDVEEFANRWSILHEGRLRFIGTPEEWLKSTGAQLLENAFLASIGATIEMVA
jgi:ABC-2 type transport system ATP-binding protein